LSCGRELAGVEEYGIAISARMTLPMGNHDEEAELPGMAGQGQVGVPQVGDQSIGAFATAVFGGCGRTQPSSVPRLPLARSASGQLIGCPPGGRSSRVSALHDSSGCRQARRLHRQRVPAGGHKH
jgi:hypothetical protein